MKRLVSIFMFLNSLVFVVPDDVDPLCSKYRYLLSYSISSNMVEKYLISVKDVSLVNGDKIYFGDGLYKKFKTGFFLSIACDIRESRDDKVVVNVYDFLSLIRIITMLNYNFQHIVILYNPMENYDNLYYYCIGKKFSDYLSKSGYKVDYVPVQDYNSLIAAVSKFRSHRVVHLVNNSIDYITYKKGNLNNSVITRFIMENTDNVILISFSSYHCKYGISHICLDSGYDEFKSSLDQVITGKVRNSIILNNKIYINSNLFKLIPSSEIDSIISMASELY